MSYASKAANVQLLVRKNRVVWLLEIAGGGVKVIPRATLVSELRKYAAKQKRRVGAEEARR